MYYYYVWSYYADNVTEIDLPYENQKHSSHTQNTINIKKYNININKYSGY